MVALAPPPNLAITVKRSARVFDRSTTNAARIGNLSGAALIQLNAGAETVSLKKMQEMPASHPPPLDIPKSGDDLPIVGAPLAEAVRLASWIMLLTRFRRFGGFQEARSV
jgi:hypothetical protein